MFNSYDDAKQFFDFINSQHNNMKFTFEGEVNNKLPFLDVCVDRVDNSICTSVYRKKTFTGLGMNFFSNIFYNYKLAAIKTLIHRAYHISSSYTNFNAEIEILRTYFTNNLFLLSTFNKLVCEFLNNIYSPKPLLQAPARDNVYIGLPYIGQQTMNCKRELTELLSQFYPQIKPCFYYKNNFTIGSFLKQSNDTPISLRSSVVYKYSCDCCPQFYIGSTKLQLFIRGSQHFGVSHRTNRQIANPENSAIGSHPFTCEHILSHDNFTILDYSRNTNSLRILESMYIHRQRPPLNDMQSATRLYFM